MVTIKFSKKERANLKKALHAHARGEAYDGFVIAYDPKKNLPRASVEYSTYFEWAPRGREALGVEAVLDAIEADWGNLRYCPTDPECKGMAREVSTTLSIVLYDELVIKARYIDPYDPNVEDYRLIFS
jgi:peptide subunit release factor 1 (eRF1)